MAQNGESETVRTGESEKERERKSRLEDRRVIVILERRNMSHSVRLPPSR